ncbi:NAD-dependent malic enzyme 62 kDa isoform, mitochondrial [Artemisia annua]|uniref:NAD-dependent malic enzyme 62 kDa isoform, mitochondrial n=1 Tax=Artemisia annua TaxID=35608 RepID=A0A2U1M3F3_ARTAN|nr:NAD-dependent malic enzyme 62 kDa isoform, mitochondrial [Artemisia annua]
MQVVFILFFAIVIISNPNWSQGRSEAVDDYDYVRHLHVVDVRVCSGRPMTIVASLSHSLVGLLQETSRIFDGDELHNLFKQAKLFDADYDEWRVELVKLKLQNGSCAVLLTWEVELELLLEHTYYNDPTTCFNLSRSGEIGYCNQGNNMYLFHGTGLGTLLSGAQRISDDMLQAEMSVIQRYAPLEAKNAKPPQTAAEVGGQHFTKKVLTPNFALHFFIDKSPSLICCNQRMTEMNYMSPKKTILNKIGATSMPVIINPALSGLGRLDRWRKECDSGLEAWLDLQEVLGNF